MDYDKTRTKFESLTNKYDSLGKNVVESIRILLEQNEIKNLSIYYRVKDVNSFLEKIERKSYEKPFEQTEDICGIRIICYYQKDISKIKDIITDEFRIYDSQDKENDLEYNEFGYRSHHLIASINEEWKKTPNFRGLSTLKFELQIRTILMHAWAEIEHNLAYKSKFQAPKQFRRKLYRISAKLEEADEQFEELKSESEIYQKELIEKVKDKKVDFESEVELNIDSLQAFMDINFPKRKKSLEETGILLDDLVEYGITLKDLSESWKKVKPVFGKIEDDYWKNRKFSKWVQVGIARIVLDMTNDKFIERHNNVESKMRYEDRKRLREKYFA